MQDAIILYENGKAIGGEGHPTDADDITFDNAGTDIVADKVGSAIKEVNAKFDREYVEVSADGTKTRAQLLNQLFTLVDFSKVRNESYMIFGTSTQYQVYSLFLMSPTVLSFTGGREGADLLLNTVILQSNASQFRGLLLTNTIAHSDSSSLVPTVGNIFRLYY